MGSTPVCQITSAGIVRPAFEDCLAYVQSAYRAIYGQDTYLGADCQDGQFMALLANAIHDGNGETVAAYNAYSPATAQGAGLSTNVKINGIRRKTATYSTCDFLSVGQVGASIPAGIVRDPTGYLWALAGHVIPAAGQVLVSGTCQTIGAISLAAGAVDTANDRGAIANPTLGWQAVANLAAASAGAPVESDSQLRQRQALSTALPAQLMLESMTGALLAITGVMRVKIHENDTNVIDANGLPGHTLAIVVEGGDAQQIAQVIRAKKPPGVGTHGDNLVTLTDAYGIAHPYRFFRPTLTPIAWHVTLRAKAGYTLDVRNAVRLRLEQFTNGLDIGQSLQLRDAYPAAILEGDPRARNVEIVDLVAQRANATSDEYGDITALITERLTGDYADVGVQVVP